jgi:hypothetical protein
MMRVARTYMLLGGGCYGHFFARQLLKWADRRQGPVARLQVVDRDPACRVARELDDPRIELVEADWIDFLVATLAALRQEQAPGRSVTERLVPPCYAPHLLLDTFSRLSGLDRATPAEAAALFANVDTPFRRDLDNGSHALSFATWRCPVSCIEPAVCPAIKQPRDWSVGSVVAALAERASAHGTPVRSCHVMSCLHEAFGVGTIPLAEVVTELDRLEQQIDADRRIGPDRLGYSIVATVSVCHGIAGALRLGGERPLLTQAQRPTSRGR